MPNSKKSKYTVLVEFRDKVDFNYIYKVGDDVSDLAIERLEYLISLGYVEAI